MGKVAVAHGDAGAGSQQAVDARHQPGEQGAGGCEADRGSLGHWGRLFEGAEQLRFIIWREFMYTRYHTQRICLHGSN